jgi:uncharacterized protein YjbI with pentapeptide repeats
MAAPARRCGADLSGAKLNGADLGGSDLSNANLTNADLNGSKLKGADLPDAHLYHASDLTILNVVWAPRMTIMPHNHQMWAVIGIYTGREDNIFWRRAGAIHVYAGDFFGADRSDWDPETLEEGRYDVAKNMRL